MKNILSKRPELKEEKLTESVIDSSALFRREELEVSTVIEQAYNTGLHHYKRALSFTNIKSSQQEYELAAYAFAEVMKPALSKPEMLSLYVKIEDYKYIILNSIEHLGEIYLARAGTFNNYAKAAAIFQYAAAFAKEHNIQASDIVYINNFYDINVFHNKSSSQNASDTNKASASQNLFIPLHQYYIDKAYEVEQLFLNNSAYKNSDSKSDTDQNKLKLYKQELVEFREIIGESLKELDKRPIEEVSIRAREVQDLYKAYSDFLVDKSKSNIDTNINGKNVINNSNTNDRDLASSGDINVNNTCGLLQRLITDCFNQLSPAPDGYEYAFIGSGSLGGGRITPWSDLEFIILINEDREEYKEYFREFTQLLHIKVINMGETPLRTAAIDELNNFKTGEEKDDWFWDEYIRKGFTFDAFHWDACKIPFGRQGGYKVKQKLKQEDGSYKEEFIQKEDFELILTPKKLAEFQHEILNNEIIVDPNNNIDNDNINVYNSISNVKREKDSSDNKNYNDSTVVTKVSWYKSDTHLVQALRMGGMLITGSQKLLDQYRHELRDESKVRKEIIEERILETLQKDLSRFSLKLGDEEEGKLIDIKKDIFRIADRAIDALALYFNISAEEGETGVSAWELIDRMQQRAHLSKDGAQHLKEALSIAVELRLATYLHNKGQRDGLSTYPPETKHLADRERKKLVEDTFYTKDTKALHHFYYVILELQKIMDGFCNDQSREDAKLYLSKSNLLDDKSYVKGLVHARFLEYKNAIAYVEDECKRDVSNIRKLQDLQLLYKKTGDIEKAIRAAERCLVLNTQKDNPIPLNIAGSHNNLGNAYFDGGYYNKAATAYNQAFDIQSNFYGTTIYNPDIARSYNNSGKICYVKGDYDQAIIQYNEALHIQLTIYHKNHPYIADSYDNIGNAHSEKKNHEQAIVQYNNALNIRQEVYKDRPNHLDIALSYNNLGTVYCDQGDFEQAIMCHDKALSIRLKFNRNNPNIAQSYINLGAAYTVKGDSQRAIEYYFKALNIQSIVYEINPSHLEIASNYVNLGAAFCNMGKYIQAIEYHTLALKIHVSVYKDNLNHLDIARNYNNIGNTYFNMKDYGPALENFNAGLNIYKIVYEDNPKSLDLALSYNYLANTFSSIGNADQGIKYFNDALKIYEVIFKTNPYHQNIADIYIGLGNVYSSLDIKNYDQAIEYYFKALNIQLNSYKNDLNHPNIAACYNNLGVTYFDNGDYRQAIEYLNKALKIYEIIFETNPYHVKIIQTKINLCNAKSKIQCLENLEQDYIKIEKLIIDSFKKYKESSRANDNDLVIEIVIDETKSESLQLYCNQKLNLKENLLVFEKQGCLITLSSEAKKLLLTKLNLSNQEAINQSRCGDKLESGIVLSNDTNQNFESELSGNLEDILNLT